ncbi:hypothetical protein KP509_02G113900 [Ceratopteris richardii]|uniref:Uncharacterized protein n=1 Tax=Ceratopteris richardii TaxID=49495 RepID=A0A8T2VL99_CERRI|nr:hypothetical protein KP509_02G113900 [Ceratopteris richardii]
MPKSAHQFWAVPMEQFFALVKDADGTETSLITESTSRLMKKVQRLSNSPVHSSNCYRVLHLSLLHSTPELWHEGISVYGQGRYTPSLHSWAFSFVVGGFIQFLGTWLCLSICANFLHVSQFLSSTAKFSSLVCV